MNEHPDDRLYSNIPTESRDMERLLKIAFAVLLVEVIVMLISPHALGLDWRTLLVATGIATAIYVVCWILRPLSSRRF